MEIKILKIEKSEIRYLIQLTLIWTVINSSFNVLGLLLTKLMNHVPEVLIESVFREFAKPMLIQSLLFGLISTLAYLFIKNKKRALYGFVVLQFFIFHLIFILNLKFSPVPFFVSSLSSPGLQYLSYNGQYLVDVLYRFVPINGDFDTSLFMPLNIGKFYFHWIFLVLTYFFGTTWLTIVGINKFSDKTVV